MSFVIALVASAGTFFLFDGLTADRRPPRPWATRTRRLLAEAGMHDTSPGRFLALSIGSALMALFVIAGLMGSLVVAIAAAIPAGLTPRSLVQARRRKRAERLRDAWPDAIANLIASVRAGISLPEACAAQAQGDAERLRSGFDAFRRSYRATGSFSLAIDELRRVLADPIADRVAVSLAIAHEVGGSDLVRTLRALGDFVRDDLRIRREIHARWSWTVTAARVAAAAPWLVLLMMATRPEAARAYNSAAGATVIALGSAATLVGYRLMLRAARLPDQKRLGA